MSHEISMRGEGSGQGQHSPLPLKIDGCLVVDAKGDGIICDVGGDDTYCNFVGDDMALIVRAVNCHEELLAALKDVAAFLNTVEWTDDTSDKNAYDVQQIIHNTLAKAEGR